MSIYLSDERMLHFAKKIKNAPFLLVLATWYIRVRRFGACEIAVLATWYIRSQKTTGFSDGCTKQPAQSRVLRWLLWIGLITDASCFLVFCERRSE